MEFNKIEFADLLKRAKGERTLNDFARDVKISPAHISRLLREMLNSPPSPEILSKIAKSSRNDVQYKDLMVACGYNNNSDDVGNTNFERKVIEQKFQQAVFPYLFSHGNVSIQHQTQNKMFDMVATINDNEKYKSWYFEFANIQNREKMFFYFGSILLGNYLDTDKLSIVVSNEREFELLLNNKPQALKANLFAMLVNLNNLEFVKEEVLCTF